MADPATRKPHLYFDQQRPLEEPVDPGQSRVTQDRFARNPPTAEDNYFRAEDERRLHPPRPEAVPPPPEPTAESWLDRIIRKLSGTFHSDWRP